MISCPDKRLKNFKDLVEATTEAEAYFLWNEFEGQVPEYYYNLSPEAIENEFSEEKTYKPTYKYSPENKEINIIERFKKPKYNHKKTEDRKLIIRDPGADVARYNSIFPYGSVKRAVAERFFRYSNYDKDGNDSPPFYPFQVSDDRNENLKYVEDINALFKGRVVGVEYKGQHAGKIVFVDNVEDAIYVGSNNKANEPDAEEPVKKNIEKPDTSGIDNAIDKISNRLKILQIRASKSGGSSELRANISDLKNQIKKLKDEKTTLATKDIVEQIANGDAVVIQKNLNTVRDNLNHISLKDSKYTKEEILANFQTLVDNKRNIDSWIGIQDFISQEKPDLVRNLEEITGKYSRLNKEWNELTKLLFLEYSNRYSYRDNFSKDDVFDPANDSSVFNSYGISMSESGIELLRIVDDLISRTSNDINGEDFNKKSEVRNWQKKLEDAGYSEKQINDIFKQLDSNGEWTGNIIGDVSHSYYQEKARLANEAKKSGKWGKYYKFIKDNSRSLNHKQLRAIYDGNQTDGLKIGYSKEELDYQKKLLDQYFEDKSAYKEVVDMKYNNQSLADEEMINWERANSPFLYSQGDRNNGHKYLLKEKPILSKWGDKNFDKIKNNKVLMEFYSFLKNRFAENNKQLGFFNHFEENYLPEKENSLFKQIMEQPESLKKFGLLMNDIKKSLSEDVEETFPIIHINGKQVRSVPIRMMSNRMSPKIKEDNIFSILNEHTHQALAHKYKTQIDPLISSSKELMSTIKELKPGDTSVEGGLTKAKKQLEYVTNHFLYDESKKKKEGKLFNINTNEEVLEDGKIVNKNVKRVVTGNKLLDALLNYTYVKTMGFNPILPMVNIAFGTNANIIYASANDTVKLSDMHKAHLQMMGATTRSFGAQKTNPEFTEKVFAFMERLHVLGVIHDSEYGSKKSIVEKISILQEKAEHFNQGSLMLAVLYGQKLIDKNGKEINLFDAYKVSDGKLIWNEELMGKQSETPNTRVVSEDKKGVNIASLEKFMDKIIRDVHGNYKDVMMAKETAVARQIALYKTWIPQAIKHRFGAAETDYNLINSSGVFGKETKGRYLSFWKPETLEGQKLLHKQTIGLLLKGFLTKKAFDKLSDVDRINMIRNMREIKHLLALYGAALLLKMLFMDDDDELKPILNFTINMMTKTSADMSFFLNPNSASQMFENVFSTYSTISDSMRVINSAFSILTGDVFYEAGNFEGYPKLFINTLRMMPASNVPIKIINYSSQTYDVN